MTFIPGREPSPSTSHKMKIDTTGRQTLCLMMLCHDAGKQRRDVLKIALNGLKNIPMRDGFDVYPVIFYEPTMEMTELVQRMNDEIPFQAFPLSNSIPLGRRHNKALDMILHHYPEMTHLMQIGSDDVITPAGYHVALSWMAQGCPFGAFTTIGIVNAGLNRVKYHRGLGNAGAGRFIHRTLIDRTIDALGLIWPDGAAKGLDGQSEKRIQDVTRCPIWPVNTYLPAVYDLKTNANMWGYEHFELPERAFNVEDLGR